MLKINILLATGYFLAGYLGDLISIPPSHASPIWPASGVALAGMITYGLGALPGLWLGAFVTQVSTFADTSSQENFIYSLALGLVASITAVAQAAVGAWLIKRYNGSNNPLIDDGSILRFMALGGPVSCLISASAGTMTLYLKSAITLENIPSSWLTWWIGDTIGVLILTPALLCLIGRPRNFWRIRIRTVALPLTVLSLLILLVLHFGKRQELARISALFEEHSQLLHNALQNEFTRYIEINRSIKALFDSSTSVSATEFKNFTETILNDHPDIQALEWIPSIKANERAAYEQNLGFSFSVQVSDGKQALKVAPQQDEYFPIVYAEPYLNNKLAIGLDISSKPSSNETIRKARDTGQTVISGIIHLIQDPFSLPSVVVYTPVYRLRQPPPTLEERRQQLRGYVANIIVVNKKITSVKKQFDYLRLLLKVTDNGNELFNEIIEIPGLAADFPTLEKTLSLHVADRSWRIIYSAAPEFYNEQLSLNIWWLILGGFLLTGMAGIGLLMLTGRTMQTEGIIKARTQELENEIAERKTAEAKIQELTRLYAVLSQFNKAIVCCSTEAELFTKICHDLVHIGGMKMAWIGLTDPRTQLVRPIASAGQGIEYLNELTISIAHDTPFSHGPTGTAIRENRPIWSQDYLNDPITLPWHKKGAHFGWNSSGALPIHNDGATVGAFNLYSGKIGAFNAPIRDLLVEMALDISFALSNFEREAKRKKVEESLQNSEQFLRTIIETEPECVKVVDRAGKLLDMNPAGLDMLEVASLDAAKQTLLLNFIVPSYQDDFIALHKSVMNGECGTLEFEIVGLKGTRRWLETYAAPLPDQSGNITMMLAVTRDITRRKQAEQALHESEKRLMLAIKGSSDAPWDWDIDNNHMYYSPQWWSMLGYEIDEMTSDAALWLKLVHPDDLDYIQQDLQDALQSGQDTHSVEFRLRHKNGHYVPILERSFFSRNETGKVIRISGTNMDLTERRRLQNLEEIRSFMLECLTSSMPLADILEAVVIKLENFKPGTLASILLLDNDGQHLHLGAAPSLPDFFRQTLDGVSISEFMDCCTNAAVIDNITVVQNIATDPNCSTLKALAEQAELASCWSQPIFSVDSKLLGTFAIYQHTPGVPEEYDIKLIETAAHYVAVTIERKRAETQIKLAAKVFEQSREGFMITDAKRTIIRVNQAFTAITGYSETEALGQNADMLASGRHDQDFYRRIWETIDTQNYWQGEIWNRRKNGEVYPELLNISSVRDNTGIITEYVGIFADITKIKDSEARLEFLAHHDPLTALPNRLRLFFRLEHAIETAKREHSQVALLMLDLDRFKDVNDSFGHLAGDQLLRHVANRLTNRLRDIDTVCRLGGDEFTVLLEDIAQPEDAARIAQALISDLSEPWTSPDNGKVLIGVSIGISLYPQHGDSPELLLQQADAALYKAKDSGRNRFAYFSNEFTVAARERIDLEARLHRALAQNELRVYYQPQFDIGSGEIVGAEALVRWLDPVEGLIPPSRFIPVTEQSGLIIPLGAWVLKETCRQGRQWLDEGLKPLTLAVNVSPHQLRQGDINRLVTDVLTETHFPAENLELELTEGALMERQTAVIELLNKLRTQNVRLAIDDFGTGYSSLAYLKRFPLDVLKIDKSFIDDIPHQQDDMEITATIIAMGHTLGFKVLAEGVETLDQLAFLQEKGCDLFQGYLKSPALPAEQFTELLRAGQSKN